MVNIRLEIERIDYEKSVEKLLPRIVDSCAQKEKPGELERFVRKLGPDTVPVTKKLLRYLDDEVKDQIIVWLVSAHGEGLTETANEYLAELLPGPAVRLGALLAQDRPGPRLALLAERVRIDYAALLQSPLAASGVEQLGTESGLLKGAAKLALQMGARLSPDALEKQGIALLGSERVKPRLLSAFSEGLEQMGLFVRFRDMALRNDSVIELPAALEQTPAKDEGLIPDAFEEPLTDAVCAWLRDTV